MPIFSTFFLSITYTQFYSMTNWRLMSSLAQPEIYFYPIPNPRQYVLSTDLVLLWTSTHDSQV